MLRIGKKTRLVPFGREHFHRWIEWQMDPSNLEFFRNFNFPVSIDEMEEFYRRSVLAQFDKKFFVIYSLKEDKPIGLLHLFDLNWQSRKVEIGILIDRAYRSKGHAFDALIVLGDYLFNRLNLNKVYVKVMENNKRLIHFCKKGGFEMEGVLKEDVYQDGSFFNQVYLAFYQRRFRELYSGYFDNPRDTIKRVFKHHG